MTQLRNLTVKRGQSDVLLFCSECGSILDNVENHPFDDIVEVAQTHVDLHNVAVTHDDA